MKKQLNIYYIAAGSAILLAAGMSLLNITPNYRNHTAIAETKNSNIYKPSTANEYIKQLFPYLSEKSKAQIDNQLSILLGNQKIKTFFYVTSNSEVTTLTSKDIKNLVKIDIITDKDNHLSIPVKVTSGDEISLFSDNIKLKQSEIFRNFDENIAYLSDFIKKTSIKDLEAFYGGPMTYQKLFNGDSSYSLMDVQIGAQKEIDAFQLNDKYKEIQNNSLEVATFIVSSFPELENKDELEKNINELVFTYTYLQKWYDYRIGGIKISDLMFSKQNMFSKINNFTAYEHLINFSQKLKSQPWSASNPGMPYAYSIFQTFSLFDGVDSLRSEGKGFDSDALLNDDGKIYMSSIIEYLVRVLENTKDYNAWFEKQGFVTATSYLPSNIGASKIGQPLWEALKSLEKNPGNSLSKGFINHLLSISDRSKISISNSAKGVFFSNTNKQLNATSENPRALAQKYADRSNDFFRFILQVGTEKQKELLNAILLDGNYWYTMDAGEFEDKGKAFSPKLNAPMSLNKSFEGLKNFYNTENVYLNQFIMASDIKGANELSNPGINGIALPVKDSIAIYLSLNTLNSELTIAHEETHRMKSLLNSGYKLRGSSEVPASFAEASSGLGNDSVTLNYYYENSDYGDWNRNIPKTKNELSSYAKNMMDLNYAWNIKKAEAIFSKNFNDQEGRVYQSTYDKTNNSLKIKKLNKNSLEKLDIRSTDSDFIDKLIKNRIVLPSDTSKQEIYYNLSSGYATIPFEKDSIFYFENSGSGDFKNDTNFINGFANLWAMEFIGNDGMQGYVDFFTDRLGKNDDSIIKQKFQENATSYMIKRYKEVAIKIENNQLKDYDSNSLKKIVENSLDNDRNARRDFLIKEIANHNNLFQSIYREPVAGRDVTIKYTDVNNEVISEPIILKGNVGDDYFSKEKSIAGYTLKEVKGNPKGKFTDKPQTINYIYTKVPVGNVTVKYLDEGGRIIHNSQVISGSIGDYFDASTTRYQLKIPGYTLDKNKLPSNIKGHLSSKSQNIIYIYKKTSIPISYHTIYRLYNKNTGEHFYTASTFERDSLVKAGWNNEGIGWKSPFVGTAVYRVYNPNAQGGDHYYTASKYEAESLVKTGWKWDNDGRPVLYSGGKTPVYVAFNPNALASGSHNYTSNYFEQQSLLKNGWTFGKVQFYGQ